MSTELSASGWARYHCARPPRMVSAVPASLVLLAASAREGEDRKGHHEGKGDGKEKGLSSNVQGWCVLCLLAWYCWRPLQGKESKRGNKLRDNGGTQRLRARQKERDKREQRLRAG